jgi:hypothetical protein
MGYGHGGWDGPGDDVDLADRALTRAYLADGDQVDDLAWSPTPAAPEVGDEPVDLVDGDAERYGPGGGCWGRRWMRRSSTRRCTPR